MIKRIVSILISSFILFSGVAFSFDAYDFDDALSDADTVRSFFHGSGSSASASTSFDRLYDFLYKNAEEYVLNVNKGKFHKPTCKSVSQMNDSNKRIVVCSRDLLITFGYSPCGNCHP